MATAPTVGKTCLPSSDYWTKLDNMAAKLFNDVHNNQRDRSNYSIGQKPADGRVIRKELGDV